jgi:hypothetical protein
MNAEEAMEEGVGEALEEEEEGGEVEAGIRVEGVVKEEVREAVREEDAGAILTWAPTQV